MKALILRLDAPLMSFGGVIIDQHGFTERFPGKSLLTGLLANALGWRHGDFERLQALQARLEYAARWDVPPERLVDYHTVDLGQPKMREPGWTTRGEVEHRAGGPDARYGTHIRYRHHWADGLMTVALALTGEGEPDLETVRQALTRPARPLFLGRKACLPARPLLDPEPMRQGPDLLAILRAVPRWDRHGRPRQDTGVEKMEACWPADLGIPEGTRGEIRRVYDLRDWPNQLPAGSRERAEGILGG
ncbi:type I-E CRISPR-associated protein Cas5/CasD [Inmirania thermothiophila]|uniref:CRISPR-associated Cas5e family protein n=1 Tax=Inmirania thermothiophila TaxID=1750597 RepID=A0A3N1Y4Z0_9GAMM|nr:type I-E CRISPR-associated protein Cas5/CasD [Inmirania thermothiophila]ROR32702.1 CRISPR-associated Cas5e family protein [Inmirania thermothiophila]